MKYTKESLAERIAACVEPKPTEPPKFKHGTWKLTSQKRAWEFDMNRWMPTPGLVNSLDFVVACVEAAGTKWERDVRCYPNPRMIVWIKGQLWDKTYTDNNHALALALCLAGALDGEPAELEG